MTTTELQNMKNYNDQNMQGIILRKEKEKRKKRISHYSMSLERWDDNLEEKWSFDPPFRDEFPFGFETCDFICVTRGFTGNFSFVCDNLKQYFGSASILGFRFPFRFFFFYLLWLFSSVRLNCCYSKFVIIYIILPADNHDNLSYRHSSLSG